MTLVRGASQFLNQATLSNLQGSTFQQTNVLSEAFGSNGLLEVGRRISRSNIGISAEARQRNKQLIESNKGLTNELFSLSGGGSATIESAQTQIAALAATTPKSRNVSAIQDSGNVTPSQNGQNVNETV